MSRTLTLVSLLLVAAVLLCSCQGGGKNANQSQGSVITTTQDTAANVTNPTQSEDVDTTKPTQGEDADATEQMSPSMVLKMLAQANTAEEALLYLVDTSEDRAKQLAEYYPSNVDVTAHYVADFRDYEVFKNTVSVIDTGASETGYCLMKRGETGYRLCGNSDLLNAMAEEFRCKPCNGQGTITTGNRLACGICSGTGWQWIPNAYYDATLNMWMGQNVGCGGCGGSGYTGNSVTEQCPHCLGERLVF